MGDCGRIMAIENSATSAAQDISDARDIARRFEQLETQWMSFQKKSAKLEVDKDTSQKLTTSSPRNHLQKSYAVSSAASSYSNPLFTNHTTAKPAQTSGNRTSSSPRTCNPHAGSEIKPDRAPFSSFRQRRPGSLATSPRDVTTPKDDHSSSVVSPSTSVRGSSCQNSEKALKDGQVSPSSETMVTRATVPTCFRDKPPLGPPVQSISTAPNIGKEKYVRCASSITRHTFRKKTVDQRRELQSSLKLPEILGLECPRQSTSVTRISSGDDSRECDGEMIESLHSITYPSTSDPATYSSGNGPSESRPSSSGLEQSSDAHMNQSRSPPSVPETSAIEADLQSTCLLDYVGVSDRNISWRVLAERGVLTEGSCRMDRHPSEFNSEEDNCSSNHMLVQNVTEAPSKDGNLLKLEVEIDQKNVFEVEHVKLGDRFDKVNWELRLSKREAALRIAEEKILEEEQRISHARLAVSRREDALRQKEEDVQRESEKQKMDLGESLKSIETGKTVMKKLCTGLKDVLWQVEQKEKVLQNTWLELKDSVDTVSVFGDHSFGFEPEVSQKDRRSATLDGISFLTAEGKCEEWCSTVVGICERLVTYMSRETHLQKWAAVLEREGMRMGNMSKEMAKAKEAASEQCARSEDMMKCAEEQAACMDEERVKLARERDNLILWVTHLQERRKAVAECEREAAKSLAEVQKKAADLFVQESNIDERAIEISALQEELRVTTQRMQDDQELISREKHKVQEKLRQVAGREKEVESKYSVTKKLQEDLNTKAEQLEKRKETLLLTLQETEARINAKEMAVGELEKELQHKVAAVEEMTDNVKDREKLLTELQMRTEQERSKIQEAMTGLEKEKMRLKEAEEAVVAAQCSKKSAEEAWARTARERQESSEYLTSVEDRLKQWEDRLRSKEKELQGQQKKLQEIENQAREEQQHSEALHEKLVQEQESWTQELKAKQESLSKRNRVLDAKEEEINNDLERLTEERRVVLEDIKRLAEMEARAWGVERDLQTKHDEHLKEVRKLAIEYNTQVEDLALAKREVKKEFEEVRAKKQELKIWQREAEETLQNRIDSFVKGKEELTAQIKELKKLQTDIEQAGSQIIDRVAELDQASTRLERQRYKVETSKNKLEALADKLATHQEVLKRRECEFLTQESKLVAVQNGLKKMAAEAATKEKNLRSREQAVIDGENDLHDVEARLAHERKDLEKMLAQVEQHAAKLKEETASVEEISRSRTRDELMIEERREQLQAKERELAEFETDLKKKAKSLEEHGQTISQLEMQVKERLQRAVDFETKSEELEKGWEQFAIEREALNRAKAELQKRVETDEVQRQMESEKDEKKRKLEKMEGLCAREAAIEAREIKAIERERALLKMEQHSQGHKDQVEKDAQELQQQLHGARTELEDQRRYVEEKCKAAQAIATNVEEKEARLKLKEQELGERKETNPDKGFYEGDIHQKYPKPWSSIVGGCDEHEHKAQMLEMQQSRHEVLDDEAYWARKSSKREVGLDYQHVSTELKTQHVSVNNQMDEGMEDRLRHIEKTFQKEATKISKERANLKLQQEDLEETKKAVEEVKLTLEAQLKATKQMVMDASLTAQNASREREAVEEERKRLIQDRKDAEVSVAMKEEKLAVEAKQLEAMKSMLEQEKAKAMEMIQQAAEKAMSAEHAKAESNLAQWNSIMLHKESLCKASLKDREKELNSTTKIIQRDKTNLQEEKAQVQMLHDVLEREQMEHPYAKFKNSAGVDILRNDEENQMAWKEIEKRRAREQFVEKANTWNPAVEGSSNDYRRHVAQQEFSFSTTKSVLETNGAVGDYGDRFAKNMQGHNELANHTIPEAEWDDTFGFTNSSRNATYNHIAPEKMVVNSNSCQIVEKNGVPNQKRLENVMTNLMYARQASRSRLQRTENALLAFPPSSGFITQIQQALNALSARLGLMEQIEEGLESHLRDAYETKLPESERMLIDKVQLLSRMEEQQNLRAEWEEDMQRQLETISMLQASSRSSPIFSTPHRDPNQGAPPINDWENHNSNMYEDIKRHDSYDKTGRIGGNATVNSSTHLHNGGVSMSSKQFSNLNWNTTNEDSQAKGFSYSPFDDYEYLSNPANQHSIKFGAHEFENNERNTRRKLQLSPPQVTYT